MKPTPEQIERVERLKWSLRQPMTDLERTRFYSSRAAEMARAEARRAPSPQLELREAA